jgi:hypothetical protein
MVSLVVLSLLDVLLFVINTSSRDVATLSLRGAMIYGLPFVAFMLLQRDGGGSLVVVDLVDVMEWSVLTPLWSRWLGTGFTLLLLTLVLSHYHTNVLVFEF